MTLVDAGRPATQSTPRERQTPRECRHSGGEREVVRSGGRRHGDEVGRQAAAAAVVVLWSCDRSQSSTRLSLPKA